MMAVQLKHRTMLLTDSSKDVNSLGKNSSEGLNYRGSDAGYNDDAR